MSLLPEILSQIPGPYFPNACCVPLCRFTLEFSPSLSLTFNQHQVLWILLSKYLLNQSPPDRLYNRGFSSDSQHFFPGLLPLLLLPAFLLHPHPPSTHGIASRAIFLRRTPDHAAALRKNFQWLSIIFSVAYKDLHNLASVYLSGLIF